MPVESIDDILVVTKEPEQRQNCHFCIEEQNERLMKHIIYTFHLHAIESLQQQVQFKNNRLNRRHSGFHQKTRTSSKSSFWSRQENFSEKQITNIMSNQL